MKCLLVIATDQTPKAPEGRAYVDVFNSRGEAIDFMRHRATAGEQFTFELYEQVLEGATTVKLETRPATERCTPACDPATE
jgi:hypothetical protein